MRQAGRLVSRTFQLDVLASPGAAHPFGPPRGVEPFVWVRGGEGMLAWGEAARIEPGGGPGRWAAAAEELAELWDGAVSEGAEGIWGAGPLAIGAFTFDGDAEGSGLVVPEVVLRRRDGRSWVTLTGWGAIPDLSPEPRAASPQRRLRRIWSGTSAECWIAAVGSALGHIERGDVAKVVLARDLLVEMNGPPDALSLANALAARFPECFTYCFSGLVGASPELLVRRRGRDCESVPLAGSRPRSSVPSLDRGLGQDLLRSPKDRREHELALSSVREALAPVCTWLNSDAGPSLLCLDNVQQLASSVRGELAGPGTALELAGRLHPSAAVGGYPRGAALGLIEELEDMDRGRYGGPVGWVDANGDGEWAIALRCAELGPSAARLFAGAGIVEGSDPFSELAETEVKLAAMLGVLSGPSAEARGAANEARAEAGLASGDA